MMNARYNLSVDEAVSGRPIHLTKRATGGRRMADTQLTGGDPVHQCKTCKGYFGTDGFYASTPHHCKQCVRNRVRSRARTDPKVQEYDRARAKLPHRRASAAKITKRWREENPLGYAAQTAVSNAIRDGRLRKLPCLFCGRDDVHAHHRDYSKPLEVIWLCPKCHHRLHAAFPETEGLGKVEIV